MGVMPRWRFLAVLLWTFLKWTASSKYSGCEEALGVESGEITDRKISASSQYNVNRASHQGRLHFTLSGVKRGAWSAGRNQADEWLQIDLESPFTRVTAVATQGRSDINQWVKKYKLQYSANRVSFQYYKELGQTVEKVFTGNTDRNTVVSHRLNPPIRARYIRFQTTSWHNHISMRVELYGCRDGYQWNFESSGGVNFLDDSNQTTTYSVGAGLYAAADTLFVTETGHLEIKKQGRERDLVNNGDELGVSFWIKHKGHITVTVRSKEGSPAPHISVDGKDYSPHSEAINFVVVDYETGEVKFTRGFELSDTEEKVQEFMKILLEGSVVLVSMAASSVHASPLRNITSQLVRKFGGNTQGTPPTWYCLIGYYGQEMFPRIQEQKWSSGKPCDITSVIMLPVCSRPLGMGSGEIQNSQLYVSSSATNFYAKNSRLYHSNPKAWCTEEKVPQFLDIDLKEIKTVTYIATQGYGRKNAWVTSYSLEYSADGVKWMDYQEPGGHTRTFAGNTDGTSVARQRLLNPIETRFVRLKILTAHRGVNNKTCLRMEIYGCAQERIKMETTKPKFGLIGPTEIVTSPGAEVIIRGYYQYCSDHTPGLNASFRQPHVTAFGASRCLASSVTNQCSNVTRYETRFVSPNKPGTYSVMMGETASISGCLVDEIKNVINVGTIQVRQQPGTFPRNCLEAQIRNATQTVSGIFKISPGLDSFDVYCEEGWTVIQRRKDGTENFSRGWMDYNEGFGELTGEFWLGNKNLHLLTRVPSVLLVELESASGDKSHAVYNAFQVRPAAHGNYQLRVGRYYGTAGDALGVLHEVLFSANDKDNDEEDARNCAADVDSAWWYKKCRAPGIAVDLNGVYPSGIRWLDLSTGQNIVRVTMKVKPMQDILCSVETCYQLSRAVKNWKDYLTSCPEGFKPAKITSQYEQNVVSEFAPANPWIGLRKQGDKFIWSDNEPASFFASDDSHLSSGDCVQLNANGSQWITKDCSLESFFVCERDNEMILLELNIGTTGRLSLVYAQNRYYLKLKLDNSTYQLRLNRTTPYNKWTRVAMSLNRTSGTLMYSENGLIISQISIDKAIMDVSWRSVAIGKFSSLADTGLRKSFAIRKLKIARFESTDEGIHTIIETGTTIRLGSEECGFEKVSVPDTRHVDPGCRIASYPVACSQTVGDTRKDLNTGNMNQRTVRLAKTKSFRSPFISDMYGCLHLRIANRNYAFLNVYMQSIRDEWEQLVDYFFIYGNHWHTSQTRLSSFTRGPYQIRVLARYNFVSLDVDSIRLTFGECEIKAKLARDFQDSFIQSSPRVPDYLYTRTMGNPWHLCYNATIDGWEPEAFHKKCDHAPHTLFLAKANSWWIFGGASNTHFNAPSNISSRCPWCKLFSFVSYDGTKSPYTSKIKQNKEAFIINSINHGPSFPPDLVLTGKNGVSDIGKVYHAGKYAQGRPRSAYLAGSAEFQLSELEVYYRSSGSYLPTKTCFAGNVLLRQGNNLTCQLESSQDIYSLYLETGCDTGHEATFEITFTGRTESIRYVKDASCGSLFEDMDINGVTEIKLKLLKRSEAINQTSVQALGYIGEQDRMELLFRSVDRYWPLQNVNQNLNISGNATSHPQFQIPMTGVTQHMTFASGGVLHFGIVNDSCITALNTFSCPNGMTVSFWLQLLKNSSITYPLKILGFGKTNETKRGFLVMQHQDNVVIRVTWRKYQCETTFDIINGSWTNIVFTLRGSTFKVYLNGEDLGSSTCASIMNSDVEQKLTSGHAVATIGELMFWYGRHEKKTVSKMFRYVIGKPKLLWINAELRFLDRDWDEFLTAEDSEVRSIEQEIDRIFRSDNEYQFATVFSYRSVSVIINLNMSFLSLGVEQIIKVDEFFMNASIILNEAVNVTSYWSSQVPAKPTNVTATSCNVLFPCLLVSWESPYGSDEQSLKGVFQGYKVLYREEGDPYGELLVPPDSADNKRQEAELRNIRGYAYYTIRVVLFTLYGHGFPSDPLTVLSGATVPGIPPENLAVLFTNTTSIQLTWSPIPPVFVNALSLLGYEVFWGRINDSLVNFTRTEQTQAWLTELEVFTEYAVVINAFNNIGSGPNSSVMIVRTTEEALSNAPQNVSGFNTSSTSINLTWQLIPYKPRISYYKINIAELVSGTLVGQINSTGLVQHIDGLRGYTHYVFTVCGVNTVGDGPSSVPVIISTDMDAPGSSPENLTASFRNSTSIRLKWSPIPFEFVNAPSLLGYEVFWRKSNDSFLNLTRTQQTQVWLTELEEFTVYVVVISAFNSVGNSPNSCAFSVKTREKALADTPQNVSGFNTSSTSINITWQPIPHQPRIIHYKINITEVVSGTLYAQINTTKLVQHIEGLRRYTQYAFTVCGVNTVGDGPSSLPVIISTDMDVPSEAPTQLTVSRINSTNHIRLSWFPMPSDHINAPVLLGYIVQYKETGGMNLQTNKTTNTWLDLELPKNDTEYLFTVIGYNERGVGPNISLAYTLPGLNASRTGNESSTTGIGNTRSVNTSVSSSSSIGFAFTLPAINSSITPHTSTSVGSVKATVNGTINSSITPHTSTSVGSVKATANGTFKNAINGSTAISQTVVGSSAIVNSTSTSHSGTPSIKQEVPSSSPTDVYATNHTSPYSMLVTWQPVTAQSHNGVLLGYKVFYTPVLVAGHTDISADPLVVTVQASNQTALLKGLSSFTVYKIEVLGFNAVGDGPLSIPVFAETCRCPPSFSTSWWHIPPYMDRNNQSEGIFPFIIENMVPSCCQRCQEHGTTVVHLMANDVNRPSEKRDHNEVRSTVEESDLNFPLFGYKGQQNFMGVYGFLPIVESPAVVFIVPKEEASKSSLRLLSSLFSCWPVLLINCAIVLLSGIIILHLESPKNSEEFPKSCLRGAWEGTWWSFITMTTVGYGDRTPRSPAGRVFSVTATLVGLVTIAVLLGSLTSSLTTEIVFGDIKLYGSKVAAVHNSSEFRLGLRKNAKMNTAREYQSLDEVYEALQAREVAGALVDALIAGSRGDLFNSSELRIYKTIEHSSVYGMVLAGDARKLQKCLADYMKENSAEISAHVASKTSVIKPSSTSAAVEQAMNLFDPENVLFREALWWSLKILAVLTVCGLTWEIVRVARAARERRVGHQPKMENVSLKETRLEMEKIVLEFYKNATTIFESFSARHKEERKKFFIRRTKRRSKYFA